MLTHEKTKSLEIRPVSVFMRECGEFLFKCPHCGDIRGIDDENGNLEDLEGEQYQCRCDGWMEVSYSAKLVRTIEQVEAVPFESSIDQVEG